MVLNVRQKLDLLDSDPRFLSINDIVESPDDILHQRLAGDFQRYKEMLRDGRIRSRLNRRRQSILARPMIGSGIEPLLKMAGLEKPKKNEGDEEEFDPLNELLSSLRYEALTSALFWTGSLCGFAVVQLDWDLRLGKAVLPRFTFIPQQRFVFAYHRPEDRTVPVATDEDLDPTTEIVLIQGYELRLLTKRASLRGERCPRSRFVVFTFDGDESPLGLGLGYSLYSWSIIKREAAQAHLMHSDRGGNPPVLGTTPANLNEKDPEVAALLAKFETFLRAVSPSVYGRFPEGFAMQVEDALAKVSPDVHEALFNLANAEISEIILGESLFSEKDSSSYGANASQTNTIEESLIDGDCSILDEQLQRQLWGAIAEINKLGKTPQVRRQTRADERAAELETQQLTTSKTRADRDAVLVNQLHLEPTEEYIHEHYGDEWSLAAPEEGAPGTPDANLPPIDEVTKTVRKNGNGNGNGKASAIDNFEDIYDFARLKMAGNTQQVKNCRKGYSCGYSCISTALTCKRVLTGQAATYASWMQSKVISSQSQASTLEEKLKSLEKQLAEETTRRKQAESAPKVLAGGVAELKPSDIEVDPKRFQYKLLGEHTKSGEVGSLTGVGKWDPNLSGVLLVWRDPADNKTYVVNGHNRLALANRLGAESVTVRYLNVGDAVEARATGAIANIAEGRGTAMDAAKFFRDTGISREDLAAKGIPMREKIAQDGLSLARLDDGIFRRVIDGDITQERGAILGSAGLDKTNQRALLELIEKREKTGKITNDTIRELTESVSASTKRTEEQIDLFGASTATKSNAIERAQLAAYTKQRLSREKKLFGTVSTSRSAEELSTAGNVINRAASKQQSEQSAIALNVFDQLKNMSGGINNALNSGADRLLAGEGLKRIQEDTYRAILSEVQALTKTSMNVPTDALPDNIIQAGFF